MIEIVVMGAATSPAARCGSGPPHRRPVNVAPHQRTLWDPSPRRLTA